MKKRNFYTLLLASMLLTFSVQAQDFDISLPKATVLHQNTSGSFNNSWGADATGYLSRMDQWNNNPHRFPWPWFISPTISFSKGFRVGLRFGFGTPGVTSLFGMAGYDFDHNQTYTGIGGNAGPLSLTYGTGGWNASLGFGWQRGFGIEMAGLNYNKREGLSLNSPFGSYYLGAAMSYMHQWAKINLGLPGTVSMPKLNLPRIPTYKWPLTSHGSNIWQSGIPRNKRTIQQIWKENLEKILRNMQQQHFSSANAMANKTEWIIDYLQEHTGVKTNDARTAPDGSKVWIHPYAFKSDWRLYHVVGHEFEHLKHIYSGDMDRWKGIYNNPKFIKAITEYRAYKWNVDHQWFVNFGYNSYFSRMMFYKNRLPEGFLNH